MATGRGTITLGHQPSATTIPKNHTSPTQIIAIQGVPAQGRPPVDPRTGVRLAAPIRHYVKWGGYVRTFRPRGTPAPRVKPPFARMLGAPNRVAPRGVGWVSGCRCRGRSGTQLVGVWGMLRVSEAWGLGVMKGGADGLDVEQVGRPSGGPVCG